MNKSNTANYKPKDFAELLGVSVKTLQRWDRAVSYTHLDVYKRQAGSLYGKGELIC